MTFEMQKEDQGSTDDPELSGVTTRWERLGNAVLIMLSVVALAEAYRIVIVPHYNFGGFQLESSGFSIPLAAILVGLLGGFLMPARSSSPSDLFLWIQFGVTVVPAAVLLSLGGSDSRAFLLSTMGLLSVRAALPMFRRREGEPESGMEPDLRVVQASWVLVLMVLGALVVSVGGSWNLDLSEVYSVREGSRDAISPAMQYLVPMAGMGLVPFLVAVALWRRRTQEVLLLAALGLAFFAFSSHKAMAFNPLVVVAGWYITRRPRGHRWVLLSIIGIAAAGLAIETMWSSEDGIGAWFTALSLHRILFLPTQITGYYVDYFSTHPPLFWAESKVTLGLLQSGLGMDAARLIGEDYIGRVGTVANSGWISTGYMNGGVLGILLYAVLIGWLYAFIDARADQIGRNFAVGVFIIPVVTLILSADLLTTLLTHGLGAVLVLSSLCARRPQPSVET